MIRRRIITVIMIRIVIEILTVVEVVIIIIITTITNNGENVDNNSFVGQGLGFGIGCMWLYNTIVSTTFSIPLQPSLA